MIMVRTCRDCGLVGPMDMFIPTEKLCRGCHKRKCTERRRKPSGSRPPDPLNIALKEWAGPVDPDPRLLMP